MTDQATTGNAVNGDARGPTIEGNVIRDSADALLDGLLEPKRFELAPGKFVDIRPLMLGEADPLYGGKLKDAALQRYLIARCVFVDGVAIGDDRAGRFPQGIAARLVPELMKVNGMDFDAAALGAGAGDDDADPKD